MNQEKRNKRAKIKAAENRKKRAGNKIYNTGFPAAMVSLGPRSQVPYKGKDRFSGMWKRFNERVVQDEERIFCKCLQTSKY